MDTTFLLMAQFETSTIPLACISERYLGMKPATADKKAGCGDLPLPTFRMGEKQRAVLVRDRKDPRKKSGNHMLVPLLGEAWNIVQRQQVNTPVR